MCNEAVVDTREENRTGLGEWRGRVKLSLINWDNGDTIYRRMLRGRAGLEVKETISFLDLLSLRCHQETEICEFPTTAAMEDIEGLQEQKGRIIFIENSVQFSHSVVSSSLWPCESQHARPPCPSPTPGLHWESRPSSQWCHPAISSSVVPFSSCPQSLPAPESFPMSQLFAWGGQSIRVSASASFLPKNPQDWSPLEWTGWISLQSKGLSRVFSNTTIQKHQFFGAQLSSQSNSHIHTWLLEKP